MAPPIPIINECLAGARIDRLVKICGGLEVVD